MPAPADLVLANARVLTLDPACPRAEAVAVRAGRILAVGNWAELRALVGPITEVVDAEGGVAVPAFHDAHLHLLSYARSQARLDCRAVRSIAELQQLLMTQARGLPAGAWVRANGYDEARLREGRHPDRHDLDAAVPDHPVRLQHRSLHLDVLNTVALRQLALEDGPAPLVERDAATGAPTGRLYHAAALLRERMPRPSEAELAASVRAASERLLAWGITTVQDASHTNGPDEWTLFERLSATGALRVRTFLMPGAGHWPGITHPNHKETCPDCRSALSLPLGEGRGEGRSREPYRLRDRRALTLALSQGERGQTSLRRVLLGPVKIMLDEATSDQAAVRASVQAAHAAGRAVAIHAVSEAEVALALDALASAPPISQPLSPDRIEHGAVIPDACLETLRALGVTVVGQPALVTERGDVYRAAYPPAAHGWLHRAGSLLRAGVVYAAGSDAPVTEPAPGLGLYAAQQRRTPDGHVLGTDERLGLADALAAFTLGPARAVGAAHLLGQLRPGLLADVAVLDPETLEAVTPEAARHPARLTLMEGRVVWRRSAGEAPMP